MEKEKVTIDSDIYYNLLRCETALNELEKDLLEKYNLYNGKNSFENFVVSGTILYVLKKIEELREK